jgi:hypothetical protein
MNANNINKQDQILSIIGLKRLMIWRPPDVSVYDKSKFTHYITSEYQKSQRKETDEAYGMFEFHILHIASGLRLTLTTYEPGYEEIVEYKVVRMFIITLPGEEQEVMDADFKKEIFYTAEQEIPFAETNRVIRI